RRLAGARPEWLHEAFDLILGVRAGDEEPGASEKHDVSHEQPQYSPIGSRARFPHQSGPRGMPSFGSVAYHQVWGLTCSDTVRTLPSASATFMPIGLMDCGRAGSHASWVGALWNLPLL